MDHLLIKTRMINELLQQQSTLKTDSDLPYNKMADILGDILDSNTYMLDDAGNLLGYIVVHDFNTERVNLMIDELQFPESYIRHLGMVTRTRENIPSDNELTIFPIELAKDLEHAFTTIVPVYGAGKRLGTVVLGRINQAFDTSDLILAEYAATVVGMQVLYQESRKKESDIRNMTMVQLALDTLSYSETKAVQAIFEELGGNEGRLTASSVADKIGITRSVIVNALRKLESAGVIETKSLGMKGTFIKILNPVFKVELEKESM